MTHSEKIAFLSVTLKSFRVTDFSLDMLQGIGLEDLLNISLEKKDKSISFRAAWVFETIVLRNTHLLQGLLFPFLDNLKEQQNWSCLRSYSKILIYLTSKDTMYPLNANIEEKIIEQTFQWMIHPRCPVAVLVNCLDILNNLSKKHCWIKEELFAQIAYFQKKKPSPALQSRTNRIIRSKS